MIWKYIIFTFCLFQPRTRDQSECRNVSHGKAQFLAEKKFEINTRLLHLYGDLQTINSHSQPSITINHLQTIKILLTVNYNPTLANILT